MKKQRWLVAIGLLMLVAASLIVANPFRPTFVRAKITVGDLLRHPEFRGGEMVIIDDEETVRELSSLLPRVGQYRPFPLTGGWVSGVTLELYSETGEVVVVAVSDDLRDFNDGYPNGDGSVHPRFEKMLLSLLEDR